MVSKMMNDYTLIFPEIFMACAAMILLIAGVYIKNIKQKIEKVVLLVFIVAIGILIFISDDSGQLFNRAFIHDSLSAHLKIVLLVSAIFLLILCHNFYKDDKQIGYEFDILVIFAVLGMMIMLSANSFISVYLGLELQSLSLYTLVAMNRHSSLSAESGLKYFVLGALSSGFLLFGISLIYGTTGSVVFEDVALLMNPQDMSNITGFGIVFVIVGIAFKISAAPFHMWTPDVYQGASTPITALLSTLPKLSAVIMLLRIVHDSMPEFSYIWLNILMILSIASMVLGAFAALGQTNIKRLLAYSSIGHIGYILIGIVASATQPELGMEAVLIYMIIYVVTSIGSFAVVLCMCLPDGMTEKIEDLAGYSQTHPVMAGVFAILLFSLAGIPPLAGFFGKYFIFLSAMKAELYALAIIGVLSSVVSAYYYLRIIKIMYFDSYKQKLLVPARENYYVGALAALLVVSFFIYPWLLKDFVGMSLRSFFNI